MECRQKIIFYIIFIITMRKPIKPVAVSSYLRHIEDYLERFSDVYNESMDIIEERHNIQNKFDITVIKKFRQLNRWIYLSWGIGIVSLLGVIALALIQYGII